MRICAIICEFNPFHNGHRYLLKEARQQSGADAILCIMSGNFVQRGDAAILEKKQRARHAIDCGADIVIELPVVFATSNAEIFASGAISILSKIPHVTHLAFGAELADKQTFLDATKILVNEPECVSSLVKEFTANGMGYAQAISTARSQIADKRLFQSPNNILGIEYTKAILTQQANIEILPIQRKGSGYNEIVMQGEFSSATAIRNSIQTNHYNITDSIPTCVNESISEFHFINLDAYEKLAILQKKPQEIAKVLDCTEGLENAFLKAALQEEKLDSSLSSPRYTASRIRRIALQNLLGIKESFIRDCLSLPLYINPILYKQNAELLSALSKALIPFLASGKIKAELSDTALACLNTENYADKLFTVFKNAKKVEKN